MKLLLQSLFRLHSPRVPVIGTFMSALGVFVAMVIIGMLYKSLEFPLMFTPLGATIFLIFAAPQALYAQPANVILGNLISASIAFLFLWLQLDGPLFIAFATASAVLAMLYLRVPHPPGAGFPLMFLVYKPDGLFMIFSILCASAIAVLIGIIYHKLVKNEYPIRIVRSKV
jgi:CBS-domain-containing membrane protein